MRKFFEIAGSALVMVMMVPPMTMLSPRSDLRAQTLSAEAKVEVKVVKYDGLKDAVKELKGKLVVVDFWSTT